VTTQDLFDAVEKSMKEHLFERDFEIRTGLVALIAERHQLQVGTPGIGKSVLVEYLVRHIDGLNDQYFHWLMGRFTTPEEIFGPPMLSKLRSDVYERNTAGKLPEAKVAFLDEVFKSSTSILNGLLTILNERFYFNNGKVHVPLSTVFFASNELPKEPELAAIWDRVTFRHEVHALREQGNFVRMLKNRINGNGDSIVPLMTWDDVVAAQEGARKVDISEEALDALNELRGALNAQGISPTERRFNDCVPIIQATAWRENKAIADKADLALLRHVLWVDIKDQSIVNAEVLSIANPIDKEAMDLITIVQGLAEEARVLLSSTDSLQARRRVGLEINGKLERATEDLEKLAKQAKKSQQRSDLLVECKSLMRNTMRKLMKDRASPSRGTCPWKSSRPTSTTARTRRASTLRCSPTGQGGANCARRLPRATTCGAIPSSSSTRRHPR
jgi:MoxR-like ATPase